MPFPFKLNKGDLSDALQDGRDALNGDSNDTEHDALFGMCEVVEGYLRDNPDE